MQFAPFLKNYFCGVLFPFPFPLPSLPAKVCIVRAHIKMAMPAEIEEDNLFPPSTFAFFASSIAPLIGSTILVQG